jgi:DMSO/TMAO reductase YedYZ molybdopterin-dependent catalytic subunit
MKKAFTFLMAAMLGIVIIASAQVNDQVNAVTLANNSNYEVQIDGRVYNANNTYTINNLAAGNHLVSVYQVSSGGIFSKRNKSLISSKQFTSGNGSVNITVNQSGQISINRNRGGSGNNDGTWNDNGDKKYGKSEGKGRGNKYGHYKNKNNNSDRGDDDNDNDDRKMKKAKKSKGGKGNN